MIVTAAQQQLWDAYTIEHEGISSIELMERASKRWLEHARPFLKPTLIHVFAGFGNNGGDALAIARMLHNEGFDVHLILCSFGKELSKDASTNLERLPEGIKISRPNSEEDLTQLGIRPEDIIIDGLFGSGLNRPLKGLFAATVEAINASSAQTLSIDIPSGLSADILPEGGFSAAKASATITFQAVKLSFLFPECAEYVGQWKVIDIGLSSGFIEHIELHGYLTNRSAAKKLIRPRSKFSHKGSYGHAAIVSGTKNTLGASILASKAAMLSGAGLTTLLSETEGINLKYPELMVRALREADHWERKTICIGPGLGTNQDSRKKLLKVLEQSQGPIVLDADALNLLAAETELLSRVPKSSILTPHPKELERLIGPTRNSLEQLDKARQFARKYNIVLLIKRAHTVVINSDGQAHFNTTGNNGLAKGGSGDVLSGMICGLLAQGYSSLSSAVLAVYVHGHAADLAIHTTSAMSLHPEAVLSALPQAFHELGI